jgi:plasmid stabilization system protein ParE
LVFYVPRDYGIEIVRVLHGARDLEAVFDELHDDDHDE